ncbi:MAG: hypothetical protein WDZ88_00220 [Candidatus Paceibacterota bacterium]
MTQTQTKLSRYTFYTLLAIMALGATTAMASEVTGTLSSDITSYQNTSGSIGGTVSSNDTDQNQTGSEVTGALSSNITSNQNTSGNIGGTVSSDTTADGGLTGTVVGGSSGGGGTSSGGSSGGSGSTNFSNESSDLPAGAVLGVTAENVVAPGFPNAGFASPTVQSSPNLWMTIVSFFKSLAIF